MHIPDGYLGPPTWCWGWAMCAGLWSVSANRIRKTLSARRIPLIAISAAFSFIIMMFNIPLPGGTTAHAVGGTLGKSAALGITLLARLLGARSSRNGSTRREEKRTPARDPNK